MSSSLFRLPFWPLCSQCVLHTVRLNGDCVGLTCDLTAHHLHRHTAWATASVLACKEECALAFLIFFCLGYVCVCVCVYVRVHSQGKYKSFPPFFFIRLLLFLPPRACLSLIISVSPWGTARTAAVPMTTSVPLSITMAAVSSLAYILYASSSAMIGVQMARHRHSCPPRRPFFSTFDFIPCAFECCRVK